MVSKFPLFCKYENTLLGYIQAVYVSLCLQFFSKLRSFCVNSGSWVETRALSCPLIWIHISDVHLNSIDHHGTRWQTYNELWSAGKGCESGFPRLNKHRHGEHEVKQSTNCQPRQWSEKRGSERKKRRKQRETGVYKQTPCYKFVFSRCQVLWPSLRLSVRSILFGLACARAVAINFTECYEPLIRLANGACNLAASEPKALWITDTRGEINRNSFSMGSFWTFCFFFLYSCFYNDQIL